MFLITLLWPRIIHTFRCLVIWTYRIMQEVETLFVEIAVHELFAKAPLWLDTT